MSKGLSVSMLIISAIFTMNIAVRCSYCKQERKMFSANQLIFFTLSITNQNTQKTIENEEKIAFNPGQ